MSSKLEVRKKYLSQKVAIPDLYVSGITLSNEKYGRKNSQTITVRNCCWSRLTLFMLGVRKFARLTYFHRTFRKQKNIQINLTVSQYFWYVVKKGP